MVYSPSRPRYSVYTYMLAESDKSYGRGTWTFFLGTFSDFYENLHTDSSWLGNPENLF